MKKKKVICIVIVSLLIIGMISGCGNNDTKRELPSTKFIKNFNSKYSTQIKHTAKFKPQDKDSDYYRAEYRLDAFKGSTGVHGSIGNASIDMVNYNCEEGEPASFRLYVRGPENEVLAMFPALAKSVNHNLSNKDIQAEINEYNENKSLIDESDVRNILDLSDSNTGKQTITSDYIINYGDHVEVFIDSDISN